MALSAGDCLNVGWGKQGGQHGLGFGESFLVFFYGVGVGDDAAADGEVGGVLEEGDGADGDGEGEVAGGEEGGDGAAVGVAAVGFEFVDDFQGADLGGPGDGAGGEGGAEKLGEGPGGFELAGDGGGGVEDGGVGFEGAWVSDADRAGEADAAEIVAVEVDDHGEFGLIFGGVEKVGGGVGVGG